MKIRSSLFLVIALNFLLILTVVSVVYIQVKSIEIAFDDVAGTTTPAIIHLHTMNEGFFEASYNAISYSLTREELERAKFDQGIANFNEHKKQLIELVKEGNTVAPDEDQALIDRLNVAEDEFVAASRNLFDHVMRDGRLFFGHDEAMLAEDYANINRVSAAIEKVQVPLQEWLEMEKEEVIEAQKEVEELVERTLFIVFALGALILFTIVFTDGFMVYRISRPLSILEMTARTVSGGNLAVRADVKTKDEFGKLATVFNEMTDKLRASQSVLEEQVMARTQELEAIKGSLEEKVKERTTELEALKSGLEKTVEERTQDLKKKMTELEQMNQMMTGRELKMVELKKELEALRQQVSTNGTAGAGSSVIVKPKRGKTNEEASREPVPKSLSSE